jgi:Ankyrin repeats (many copies)
MHQSVLSYKDRATFLTPSGAFAPPARALLSRITTSPPPSLSVTRHLYRVLLTPSSLVLAVGDSQADCEQDLEWLCAQITSETSILSTEGTVSYFKNLFRAQSSGSVRTSQSAPALAIPSSPASASTPAPRSSPVYTGTHKHPHPKKNDASSTTASTATGGTAATSMTSGTTTTPKSAITESSPGSEEASSRRTNTPSAHARKKKTTRSRPRHRKKQRPAIGYTFTSEKTRLSSLQHNHSNTNATSSGASDSGRCTGTPISPRKDSKAFSIASLSSLTPRRSRRRVRSSSESALPTSLDQRNAALVHEAVRACNVDALRSLHQSAVPISGASARDTYGNTPLAIAVKNGARPVIQFLVLCEVGWSWCGCGLVKRV